jgi:hypothetical protein
MKTITFGKFERDGIGSDSESFVFANGNRVGLITGRVRDCGSLLVPKWKIEAYEVDVCIDGSDFDAEFATKGDAKKALVAFVK